MKHQILIASYHKDFPWLRQCLRSLEKFARGFGMIVVAVPSEDYRAACLVVQESGNHNTLVKVWDGPDFGRAQDAMMSGDILCPSATHYWLLGSDCIAVRPFAPEDYLLDGKPLMLYHSWEHMRQHARQANIWYDGVDHALGWKPEIESMRRLPLIYPTSMLSPMRDYISARHECRFTPYVWDRVNRVKNFSESNVMGEWAWKKCPSEYTWWNLDLTPAPPFRGAYSPDVPAWKLSPILQMWSHGGLDVPHSAFRHLTPREIIMDVLGSL